MRRLPQVQLAQLLRRLLLLLQALQLLCLPWCQLLPLLQHMLQLLQLHQPLKVLRFFPWLQQRLAVPRLPVARPRAAVNRMTRCHPL